MYKVQDWKQRLVPGNKQTDGFPHPYSGHSKSNILFFLLNHENFSKLFAYDEFADEVLLVTCPSWDKTADFKIRRVNDCDIFMVAANLETCKIKTTQEVVREAIIVAAKLNSINPPKQFMESLKWDGTPRLNTWLTHYLGAKAQVPEYLALVGSKWLIGVVGRIYSPGSKFDTVMILEGTQGIGKSSVLRELATLNGKEYFLDNVGDIQNKDTYIAMQGKIIIEMSELVSFRKSENEELKAFISRQVDEYRPPYGRQVQKRPRRFSLAGSTNEDGGYLTDSTGNRRFWPVRCGENIDLRALNRDKNQLWAEAVHRYKSNEICWINDQVSLALVQEQQKERFDEDAWHDIIGSYLKPVMAERITEVTIDEILTKPLNMPVDHWTQAARNRVVKCLRSLGYKKHRAKKNDSGKRPWCYKLIEPES